MSLRIVMVGPSGVGKTSLLAAMRNSFEHQNLPIILRPEGKTSKKLYDKWGDLLEIEEGELYEEPPAGIIGTSGFDQYFFKLCVDGQRHGPNLEIVDIRGGMVTDQDPKLMEIITSSVVVFHVVDAAVMMELSDEEAKHRNDAASVLQVIKTNRQGAFPLLIVSILTKCEKYLREKQEPELRRTFDRHFAGLTEYVASQTGISHRLVAVETLGCVQFSRLVRDGKSVKFVFLRKSDKLKPSRLETPLQLAISHALKSLMDDKPPLFKMIDWMTGQRQKEHKALMETAAKLDPKYIL